MELTKLYGIERQTIQITSQEVLRHFGYHGPLYKPGEEQRNNDDLWYQQMLVRAMREIPEFLLPELVPIADDQRLVEVLSNLESVYSEDIFIKHDLEDFRNEPADVIRQKLGEIVRVHPIQEPWLKNDYQELASVTKSYKVLTNQWLLREK